MANRDDRNSQNITNESYSGSSMIKKSLVGASDLAPSAADTTPAETAPAPTSTDTAPTASNLKPDTD